MSSTRIIPFLVGLFFLLFASACPPTDTVYPAGVQAIPLSERVCDPQLADFVFKSDSVTVPELKINSTKLPGQGATRFFSLPSTGDSSRRLILNRYTNYPLSIGIEVLVGNLSDGFQPAADPALFRAESTGLIDVLEGELPANSDILIRVEQRSYILPQTPFSDPGSFDQEQQDGQPNTAGQSYEITPLDTVSFAAFYDLQDKDISTYRDRPAQPYNCGEDDRRLRNELVFSVAAGQTYPAELMASIYNLPIADRCGCAPNLVAYGLPPSVHPQTAEPKAKATKAKAQDTSATDLNPIFTFPQLPEDFKPADDCDPGSTKPGEIKANSVRIAIVDSGVDQQQGDLLAFSQTPGQTACQPGTGQFGYDLIDATDRPWDTEGHGSSVTRAVVANWPTDVPLDLKHYRFYGPDGGDLLTGTCASYIALAAGTDVINLSWGAELPTGPTYLRTMIEAAGRQQVVVVTASGNENRNLDTHPDWPGAWSRALLPNLLTVGANQADASGSGMTRPDYGNYSANLVSLSAPAVVALPAGGSSRFAQGTSISSGYVAARMAYLRHIEGRLSASGLIDLMLSDRYATHHAGLDTLVNGGWAMQGIYGPAGCPPEDKAIGLAE